MCAKFKQKTLNFRVVGAIKVFKSSGKIPGFLQTIELCLNFSMVFWITLLILSNYNKISP